MNYKVVFQEHSSEIKNDMKGINWKEYLQFDKSERIIERWSVRMQEFEQMIQNRLKISKTDKKRFQIFDKETREILDSNEIDQQTISKFSTNIIEKYFDENSVGRKDIHIIREFITQRIKHIERDGFKDKLKHLTHKKWLQVNKAREHLEKIYVYLSNKIVSRSLATFTVSLTTSTSMNHNFYDENGVIRPIIGNYLFTLKETRSMFAITFLLLLVYEGILYEVEFPQRLLQYLLKNHFDPTVVVSDHFFSNQVNRTARLLDVSPLEFDVIRPRRKSGAIGNFSLGTRNFDCNFTDPNDFHSFEVFTNIDLTKDALSIAPTVKLLIIFESEGPAKEFVKEFWEEVVIKKMIIVIYVSGLPDLFTRRVLHSIGKNPDIVSLGYFDSDPPGIRIFKILKHGTRRQIFF